MQNWETTGLSEEQAQAIVAEREAHGRYRSLGGFIRRIAMPRELVQCLIQVGAFDEFGISRRECAWQVGLYLEPKQFGTEHSTTKRPRKKDHVAGLQQPLPIEQDTVRLPPTTAVERLRADYEVLGLSVRYHPIGVTRPRLPAHLVTAKTLLDQPDGTRIQIGGMVVVRQRPETAKGVTFLLLEDETGLSNVIIYPALYQAERPLVRGEAMLLITGKVQRQANTINVVAERIEPLSQYLAPDESSNAASLKPVEELSPSTHNYR